jgi:hypothetical protein
MGPIAELILPAEASPASPPGTPAAPDTFYEQLDYEAMLEEQPIPGIAPAEFRDVFSDAHRLVQDFGGVAMQEVDGPGNDPGVIRALATLGADIRIGDAAERDYLRELPQGTKVQVKPLEGAALTQYINQRILSRLDRTTRSLIETSGVLTSAEGQRFLTNVAQRLWRHEHLLPQLMGQRERLGARQAQARETAAVEKVRAEVSGWTDDEFRPARGSCGSAPSRPSRRGVSKRPRRCIRSAYGSFRAAIRGDPDD